MELFEEIENTNINEDVLKGLLTIEHLPELCNSINTVISNNKDSGVIYCVWGD